MKSGLLDDMPKEHREQLERRFETRAVAAGEVIFQEGDPADRLYLVKSGRVRIEKSDLDVLLVTVEPGEEFGAMAALDGSPRSARAVAAQDTVLLSLSAEALEDLAREHRDSAYSALLRSNYGLQSQRLRRQNDTMVEALRSQLAHERSRVALAGFLCYMIGLISLYGLLLRVGVDARAVAGGSSTPFTGGLLLVCVAIQFAMVKRSPYPLSTYGLTLRDWKRHAAEAVPWSLLFCAAATLVKWLLIQTFAVWSSQPLFAFPVLAGRSLPVALAITAAYVLFVPAQEFMARGAIQGSLEEFLTGPRASLKANLIANLVFSTVHLHLSQPVVAVLVFLPSLLWGWLFSRQRSLVGVCVSHVGIGVYVILVLGLGFGFR